MLDTSKSYFKIVSLFKYKVCVYPERGQKNQKPKLNYTHREKSN